METTNKYDVFIPLIFSDGKRDKQIIASTSHFEDALKIAKSSVEYNLTDIKSNAIPIKTKERFMKEEPLFEIWIHDLERNDIAKRYLISKNRTILN